MLTEALVKTDGKTDGTGLKLSLADTGDSVRLEGQDGVGREVARRTLAKLAKRPFGLTTPGRWARSSGWWRNSVVNWTAN